MAAVEISEEEKFTSDLQVYEGGVQLQFPWWIREHESLENRARSVQYILSSLDQLWSLNDKNLRLFFLHHL
jgi:hypothetical protein